MTSQSPSGRPPLRTVDTEPLLADIYAADLNDRPASTVGSRSSLPAWFRCPSGHTWREPIRYTLDRARGRAPTTPCPACFGKVRPGNHQDNHRYSKTSPRHAGTVADDPNLSSEWADQRDPSTVPTGSKYIATWRCNTCANQWTVRVSSRSLSNTGCPNCASNQHKGVMLAAAYPAIAAEWLLPEDGDPTHTAAGSHKTVVWKCATCSHEWRAQVRNRTKGRGCPACTKRQPRAQRAPTPPASDISGRAAACGLLGDMTDNSTASAAAPALMIGTDRTRWEWEPIGDPNPADRLLATIVVNGCPVHLEAIRVQNDDNDMQRACQDDLDNSLDGALMISSDGPFQTATITVDGTDGDYVIVAVSYAT